MQPASISYGRDTTAVAADDDDEGDGGDENLAGQEFAGEHKEQRVMTSDQADAAGMQVQGSPADTETSSVSSESTNLEKQLSFGCLQYKKSGNGVTFCWLQLKICILFSNISIGNSGLESTSVTSE